VSDQSVIYPIEVPYGVLGVDPDLIINVMAWNAIGDGTTPDSEAIQEAANQLPDGGGVLYFPPGRTFLINSTIFLPYGTKIWAYGATFTAAPVSTWVSPQYFGIYIAFTTPTFGEDGIMHDGDYGLFGAKFDFASTGEVSPWSMWYIRNSIVRDCHFIGGQTQCQHVRSENTTISHCTFEGWQNAACDHFDSPINVRVSFCYFHAKQLNVGYGSQTVTFNAVPVVDRPQGGIADGFILEGCEFDSDKPDSTPNQIEPLGEPGTARNVLIVNNIFRNQYLVCRGDCQNYVIANNIFYDITDKQAIQVALRVALGDTPDNIVITNNVVVNPSGVTASGIIQCDATNWSMTFNRVTGTAMGASPSFYATVSQGTFFGNTYENGVANIPLFDVGTIGFNVSNNNNIGLYDASGSRARWRVQSNDNMIMSGSGSAGAERIFMALQMRSDTSELTFPLPALTQGVWRTTPSAGIAATGTVIGTAASLTSNINRVTSCTAGVNDGVILIASTGREQTVINETAAILKVYPNNSGSATIDGGGVGIPATIAANSAKTFVQVTTNNFRTI
jgi:hypothetical protein